MKPLFALKQPLESATAGPLLTGLVLIAALRSLEQVGGFDSAWALTYAVPVAYVAWYTGWRTGLLTALLALAAWYEPAVQQHMNGSEPGWSLLTTTAVYFLLVTQVERVRTLLASERSLSRTDALTGIANRRAFLASLEHEIERQRRFRRPFTLLLFDVDNFKPVNDRFGHAAGDALVRAVARTLSHGVRNTDMVGRLGGDEFVVLLLETGPVDARTTAGRLQDELRTMTQVMGWPVTFSLGAVTCFSPRCTAPELLEHADLLMYDVKRSGKDGASYEVINAPTTPVSVTFIKPADAPDEPKKPRPGHSRSA